MITSFQKQRRCKSVGMQLVGMVFHPLLCVGTTWSSKGGFLLHEGKAWMNNWAECLIGQSRVSTGLQTRGWTSNALGNWSSTPLICWEGWLVLDRAIDESVWQNVLAWNRQSWAVVRHCFTSLLTKVKYPSGARNVELCGLLADS